MMKYKRIVPVALIVTISLLFTACTSIQNEVQSTEVSQTKTESSVKIAQTKDINSIGIHENKSVYNEDDPSSIVYFYVTVRRGTQGTATDHSFEEVNSNLKYSRVNNTRVIGEDVFADALVQVGDENGPVKGEFGYNSTQTNATIRKRGNSSSNADQKSYALKLDENAGLWRGQSNIALNKHIYDATRLRNKLYFDLLKEVPGMASLRTQFTRLYIKDETSGSQEFVDYGVYTQIEVPNKKYLNSHGLDPSGYLYKAIGFNFEKNPAIKNFDESDFDLDEFEKVLTCKGREDNTKLLEMIDAVNNTSYDIDYVIDHYFDRENYITWLAYNILMGNIDTTMQNFYLYSPLNGDKWYFIPWDSDASLRQGQDKISSDQDKYDAWVRGISNYWGIILHQRFLKVESNRQQLADKMEELRGIITRQKMDEAIKIYTDAIGPYVESMPDILYAGYTTRERAKILQELSSELDANYNTFKTSLDNIMPFFLFTPKIELDSVLFSWGDAYDFKNQNIQYTFEVSKTLDFSQPIYSIKSSALSISIPKPSAGTYYWRVKATTADGRSTNAFNKIRVSEDYGLGIEKLVIQ